MCRYSLLFSSGLAPALGWEQSCQSRRSLDRHGGHNGRIAGFVGAVWPRGEFRDERGKARDKGARAVFLEGAKVGEEVTIVSDDGRDDVGFGGSSGRRKTEGLCAEGPRQVAQS